MEKKHLYRIYKKRLHIITIILLFVKKSCDQKNDLVSFIYYSSRFSAKIRHDMRLRINIHERTYARIDSMHVIEAWLPCLRSAR